MNSSSFRWFKITYLERGGIKLLGHKYEVLEEKVRTWVSRYRSHGVDGLRPKRSSYIAGFKLEVLYRQEREQQSCRHDCDTIRYP